MFGNCSPPNKIKSVETINFKAKNGDFKIYYDTTQKRHYWLLGYFGNTSVADIYEAGVIFSWAHNVLLETVQYDEILSSRRFKSFKFLSSQQEQQPHPEAVQMENVYQFLRD